MATSIEYFRRRLSQEEAAANNAVCERSRDAHLEMARTYRAAIEAAHFPGEDIEPQPAESAGKGLPLTR